MTTSGWKDTWPNTLCVLLLPMECLIWSARSRWSFLSCSHMIFSWVPAITLWIFLDILSPWIASISVEKWLTWYCGTQPSSALNLRSSSKEDRLLGLKWVSTWFSTLCSSIHPFHELVLCHFRHAQCFYSNSGAGETKKTVWSLWQSDWHQLSDICIKGDPAWSRISFLLCLTLPCLLLLQASHAAGIPQKYGLNKRLEPVSKCRSLSKRDMPFNDFLPKISGTMRTLSFSSLSFLLYHIF